MLVVLRKLTTAALRLLSLTQARSTFALNQLYKYIFTAADHERY